MRPLKRRLKIGIVGCGAIGARIAETIKKDLNRQAQVSAIFDIDEAKSLGLARKFSNRAIVKNSLEQLIKDSDLVVEAVNATDTRRIIRQALLAKRSVLAMSVGKLLNARSLFQLAQRNGCFLLLPSGAIAGLDALKAAGQVKISSLTLTTRKPVSGFANNSYVVDRGIDLERLDHELVIFDGSVDDAVKFFPQNINVAATLAIACQAEDKLRIRIITSPAFTSNSHEIEMVGEAGRIVTRTDNVICPDNPKTSYLAVLSAIQTLRQFFSMVKIGT